MHSRRFSPASRPARIPSGARRGPSAPRGPRRARAHSPRCCRLADPLPCCCRRPAISATTSRAAWASPPRRAVPASTPKRTSSPPLAPASSPSPAHPPSCRSCRRCPAHRALALSLSLRAQIRPIRPRDIFRCVSYSPISLLEISTSSSHKQNQIWRSSQKRSSLRLTSEHRDRGGESRRGVDDRCRAPCRRRQGRCPAVAMRGPKCPLPPHVRPLVEQELDLRQQQLVRYLRGGGHPQPCRP